MRTDLHYDFTHVGRLRVTRPGSDATTLVYDGHHWRAEGEGMCVGRSAVVRELELDDDDLEHIHRLFCDGAVLAQQIQKQTEASVLRHHVLARNRPKPKQAKPTGPRAERLAGPFSVYIIGDGEGRQKIGHSKDPVNRLQNLQCANPRSLTMMATWSPGGRAAAIETERRLHQQFGQYRLQGDWFAIPADHPELAALIECHA